MIKLQQDENDSPVFLEYVEALVNGAAQESGAERVYVVKIDKWFPAKWCEFSGKVHGALGVWKQKLTLPPFVPSRVAAEALFALSPGTCRYESVADGKPVHIRQASSENLKRFVERFDRGAGFVWYSGSTAKFGKGCLMAYMPVSDRYVAWYAEIEGGDQPKLGLLRGISQRELDGYAEVNDRGHR